jgi:hypothetical protein
MSTRTSNFFKSIKVFLQHEAQELGLDLSLHKGKQDISALYSRFSNEIAELSDEPFFNSGCWLETWLSIYDLKEVLSIAITVRDNDKLAGVFAVNARNINVMGKCLLQPIGQGEDEHEEVLSEYQDILCTDRVKKGFIKLISSFIQRYCYRVEWRNALSSSNISNLLSHQSEKSTISRFIFEQGASSILQSLSRNSKKKYSRLTNKLQDVEHRLYWANKENHKHTYTQLVNLHNLRWSSKGKQGAMHDEKFTSFHQHMLSQKELAKFSILEINKTVVAIHYYLSFADTLYFYQSGWLNNQYSEFAPGFLLHIWSINNSTESTYDFMISKSDNQLKRQLSNKIVPAGSFDCKVDKFYCYLIKAINVIKNRRA